MFWPRLAKLLLKLGRWTPVGPVPTVKKAVIIGVPHTSYWDGYWLLVYKVAHGLDVKFLVKSTLFWFPLPAAQRHGRRTITPGQCQHGRQASRRGIQ